MGINTHSVLLLVVCSSEFGRSVISGVQILFLFGNSDILFRKSLPVSFVAAHNYGRSAPSWSYGSHSRQGKVTSASMTGEFLTPESHLCL